ncbi:MAG TPA: hypothetical protein VH595_04005 [Verrucomicrobiae bacterium]|jgi:hypothetical protein|nr:hypothetical protein [Verrucomicrobiae bacterium]
MKTHSLKNHGSAITNKSALIGIVAITALALGLNANAGSYTVTYTVTGSSSTGATPQPSSPSVYFPVYTSGTTGSLWGTMTVQATYTWVSNGDNPPAQIEVEEFVDVGVEVYGTGLYNPEMSDPFNDPETIEYDTTTDIDEYKETNPGVGHSYIQNNPGESFTSPPRTISSSVDGTTIGDEVYLEYQATTFQN